MRTEDQTPVFEWRALGADVEAVVPTACLIHRPWHKGPYS